MTALGIERLVVSKNLKNLNYVENHVTAVYGPAFL